MRSWVTIIATVITLFSPGAATALAQPAADSINVRAAYYKSETLIREYRFEEALELCRNAAKACTDSVQLADLNEQILFCENGINMKSYVYRPRVVARQRFHLDEFFLYYPLPDRSWRDLPNQLDSLASDRFCAAIYIPETSSQLYFSETDSLGVRNLRETHRLDSLWSMPAPLGEELTSPENEIWPMRCGNNLYFASRGLYGLGGYDLYVSTLDEVSGEWSRPENLGFPYNSPEDDFMFINTDDGKYSIFASNRDCSPDSVYLYVMEYDPVPVRSSVDKAEELKEICMLRPSTSRKQIDNNSAISESVQADERSLMYARKMKDMRALRDSISRTDRELAAMREKLSTASPADKAAISSAIVGKELLIPAMNARLAELNKEIQKVEMDFLLSGVVIDMSKAIEESDKEVVGVESSYTFSRKSKGKDIKLLYLRELKVPEIPNLEIPDIPDIPIE